MGERKAWTFVSLFLMFTSLFPLVAIAQPDGTIRVPRDYPTIQEAVNAASPGDTILVSAGTYRECVYVNKSLRIVGEDPTETMVWDMWGEVFHIQAVNTTVTGFTMDTWTSCVALVDSRGCNISRNTMLGGSYTITLQNSSNNLILHNDIFPLTNGAGMELYAYSDNNVIRSNHIAQAREGAGIFLVGGDSNVIEDNEMIENEYGILVNYGRNNTIRGNTIAGNLGKCINFGWRTAGNRVYRNNLVGNPSGVADDGDNTWDNGCEGNYWSDYNGTDLNGDGVGDTNLPWLGVDSYPLMSPWAATRTFFVNVDSTVYPVVVHCNSTVARFNYTPSLSRISFNVTGPTGSVGFCNVTIPKALLTGYLAVLVDDEEVASTAAENATYTSLQFLYTHSTRRVRIEVPILGDLNVDGIVNIHDIIIAVASYGATPTDPRWNPRADVAPRWEVIDIYDLVTIVSLYGNP